MADHHEKVPDAPPGPNINQVGDGARVELPSVDLAQRFGRGVRKGVTSDTATLFYYFAGSPWMRALEPTNGKDHHGGQLR